MYREAGVWAFMDIAPLTPGHVLVVPTAHAEGLRDLPPATGAAMFRLAQRVAAAQRRAATALAGINLFLADGREAGQEVMHVHLHVVPRLRGDKVRIDLSLPHRSHPPRTVLDATAATLRQMLDGAPEAGVSG